MFMRIHEQKLIQKKDGLSAVSRKLYKSFFLNYSYLQLSRKKSIPVQFQLTILTFSVDWFQF